MGLIGVPSHAATFAVRVGARLCAVTALAAAFTGLPLIGAYADSMTVTSITSSATPTTNAAGSKPTLTVQGTNIPSDATLRLTPTFSGPADPNAIPLSPPLTAPATSVTDDGTTWTWTGSVNFAHATAGDYTVELLAGQSSASCTCTFTVASAGPPSPGPQVTPGKVAQGSHFVLTIPDDAVTPGAAVSFSGDGVNVSGPAHFGASTDCTGRCILVPVTVAPDAKTDAARDVIVTDLKASSTDTTNVGKCLGCLRLGAGPTLDNLDPGALGQGAATTLTLTGSNFADKAVVTFGNGITATDKPTVTSTKVSVPVKVAATTPATVTVTLTNPDFGTASKDLTINPGPTLTQVAPQYVAAKFSGTLSLTGTGIGSDAALSFPSGSGISVPAGSTPTIGADGTTYSVPIKVQRTDSAAVDVTITNSDHGAATCVQCLSVAVAPADVTNMAATRTDTTVSVNWAAVPDAATGGAPITGYTVSVLQPSGTGIKPRSVTTTSATFSGLSATLNYTFKVVATNAAKLSSAGVVASTGGQEAGTLVLLNASSAQLVAGQRLTLSGHLADATGKPVDGATILVTARDTAGQTTAVGTSTTDSAGHWIVPSRPMHNATYVASFAGDANNAPATSRPVRVAVTPRVTLAAARTSSSAHWLVVTGNVSPNKAAQTVHLTAVSSLGSKKNLGTTTLTAGSTYRFKVQLAKGKWELSVRIASTPGNVAGHSQRLRIART